MARTVVTRVFNSMALIGLVVFIAVCLTMVLPDTNPHHLPGSPLQDTIHPALQAAGFSTLR